MLIQVLLKSYLLMFLGRPPFLSKSVTELAEQILHEDPFPPTQKGIVP